MASLLKSIQRKIQDAFGSSSGFTREMQVGDHVIHNATQRRGTVTTVQKCEGVQQISVKLDTGEMMQLLDRREFNLCSK